MTDDSGLNPYQSPESDPADDETESPGHEFGAVRRLVNAVGAFVMLYTGECILVTLLAPPGFLDFADAPMAELAFVALMLLIAGFLTLLNDRSRAR